MPESVTPLDDVDGFYVRLARDLRELFQKPASFAIGVSPFEIWRVVAAAGDAPLGPEPFDFAAHLQRQRAWSERTFGPGSRAKGVVQHIRKELGEIEAAPGDLTEWIDVAILALDGAWRSGATPHQIIDALVAKQAKNEGRTWPDWRTMDPDAAIEHDRTGEPIVADCQPEDRSAGLVAQLNMEYTRGRNDGWEAAEREGVYVPGLWRCAKCNFQLMQSNLSAITGAVTARDEPGGKCPNCNTLLRRVTYKDAYAEALHRFEEHITAPLNSEDARMITPPTINKQVCAGCPHLKTEYWKDYLDNDETDSGTSADCLRADRHITSYWGKEDPPPDWCPLRAIPAAAAAGGAK